MSSPQINQSPVPVNEIPLFYLGSADALESIANSLETIKQEIGRLPRDASIPDTLVASLGKAFTDLSEQLQQIPGGKIIDAGKFKNIIQMVRSKRPATDFFARVLGYVAKEVVDLAVAVRQWQIMVIESRLRALRRRLVALFETTPIFAENTLYSRVKRNALPALGVGALLAASGIAGAASIIELPVVPGLLGAGVAVAGAGAIPATKLIENSNLLNVYRNYSHKRLHTNNLGHHYRMGVNAGGIEQATNAIADKNNHAITDYRGRYVTNINHNRLTGMTRFKHNSRHVNYARDGKLYADIYGKYPLTAGEKGLFAPNNQWYREYSPGVTYDPTQPYQIRIDEPNDSPKTD